jgi:subtilase family serine protease
MQALRSRANARGLMSSLLALGVLFTAAAPALAQTDTARVLITAPVDDSQRVPLPGNTRSEATAANDRGRLPDAQPLHHLQLLLKRPIERELALQRYIAQLHDRRSPYFHRWLTAAEIGRRYGVAPQDLTTISEWLSTYGFTVNSVYPATLMIDFTGTAGSVRAAFHTELHVLTVRGVRHIANMSDPQIPAALAPAIAGVVSLHDFRPHPAYRPRATYSLGSGTYAVVPADLATIYNLNPLFTSGVTGEGQTIVAIEDADVYSTADWSTFRSVFGLSSYSRGSFTEVHPGNCTDPGYLPGSNISSEASLDVEWASAAAPDAAIELASCQDTETTFGGLIALENLLAGGSPPAIVTVSYEACEVGNGVAANGAFSSTYQTAVTEGVSVFVAAGDSGAADCDPNAQYAANGIAVNGFASTAYNVAVGGTDFSDTYSGTQSTYWSSTNGASFGSALSYVPEIPWNDSCASTLIAGYNGYALTYGSGGSCNSGNFQDDVAGGGGPSSCALLKNGACAGTPKPAWQAGARGNPADGVRDLPDVSLFAANGLWGHYYVFCWSDTGDGGNVCSGAPSAWSTGGGTSFAAPILAGIQALVNQKTGARQGNPNYVFYPLAASQSAAGLSCNASSGNAVASGCVFYDVTLGDMDVDCEGTSNCYLPSGTYGVLSTSDTSYAKAYGATANWDFATGIGSINAANLVKYWNSADISLRGSGTVNSAGLLDYSMTVGNQGPQSASGVTVSVVLPGGFALMSALSSKSCAQSGQTVTCAIGTLAAGAGTPLTVAIQPTLTGTVVLAFTASSADLDLDPADGYLSLSLDSTGDADVPLPPWASILLGVLLLATVVRRLTAGGRGSPNAV